MLKLSEVAELLSVSPNALSGIEKVSDFLYVVRVKNDVFYIKTSSPPPVFRSPKLEYKGYQVLSSYFRMPKVKLYSNNGNEILIIVGVKAKNVTEIMKDDPHLAVEGFERFIGDMLRMWGDTVEPLREEDLVRDMRVESMQMAKKLLEDEKVKPFLKLKVIANGKRYPSLYSTFIIVMDKLEKQRDPVMVLRHGDEQVGNVLVKKNSEYWLIDPECTGKGSPFQAVNTLVGSQYIFYYDYEKTIKRTDSTIEIAYELKKNLKEVNQLFVPIFQRVIKFVDELSEKPNLLKEYLYINFMRCVAGKLERPDMYRNVLENWPVYIALANQVYYGDILVK